MRMVRILLIITMVLGATHLSSANVSAAAARAQVHKQYGQGTKWQLDLDCRNGLCSLILPALHTRSDQILGTSSFVLQAFTDNIAISPDGSGITLSKLISLQTPLGLFELFDADIVAELTAKHEIQRLYGMAKVPLPSLGIFDNGAMLAPALAEIGLDLGSQLAFLNQELLPDRPYFFFRVATTPNTQTAEEPAAQALSSAISVPAGQSLTFILDLAEPQLYLDGNLALKNLNQLAMLSQLVGVNSGLPFQLIDEAARFHVTGALSPQAGATFLQIDGLYRIDPQFLQSWFGSAPQVNQVVGSLTLGPDGALFRSQVDASLFPKQLFAGNLTLEAFIPFAATSPQRYIDVQAAVQLPLVERAQEQLAQLSLAHLSFATLQTPVQQLAASTRPIFVMVKDSSTDALLFAARGYETAKASLTQGYQWSVEVALNTATNSTALATFTYHSARSFAVGSSAWLGQAAQFRMRQASTLATTIYSTAADFTSAGYQWAGELVDSGVDTVTDQAQAGYGAAKQAASTTYETASSYLNDAVIPGMVETYNNTTDLVAESAGAVYAQTDDYVNSMIITNATQSYESAAAAVDSTVE